MASTSQRAESERSIGGTTTAGVSGGNDDHGRGVDFAIVDVDFAIVDVDFAIVDVDFDDDTPRLLGANVSGTWATRPGSTWVEALPSQWRSRVPESLEEEFRTDGPCAGAQSVETYCVAQERDAANGVLGAYEGQKERVGIGAYLLEGASGKGEGERAFPPDASSEAVGSFWQEQSAAATSEGCE